jgi:hypothetical protein
MTGLRDTATGPSSPFAAREVRSEFTSLEEARQEAVKVFHGSLTRRTLVTVVVALLFLAIMGYNAVGAHGIAMAGEIKTAGAVILCLCAAALAYVVYEYRRKQHIFILKDSFAIERRFRFDVELIRWTDVARLYCVDRITETKVSVYFIPVATSRAHRAKLRIVLMDGRQIVLTNRVRDFSALAAQFVLRTMAAQLAPAVAFLLDGGTLDFDKFSLTSEGLIHRRTLLPWSDIERISLNRRGTLLFKTPKLWWSPRFNTDTLPNSALLLELLPKFGGDIHES